MIQILSTPISAEERETHLWIDNDGCWTMDSSISKDWKKALKCGWVEVGRTIDEKGNTVGMILSAPRRAITIRGTAANRKALTEEQRQAATDRLARARETKAMRKEQ